MLVSRQRESDSSSLEELWNALVGLRRQVRELEEPVESCSLRLAEQPEVLFGGQPRVATGERWVTFRIGSQAEGQNSAPGGEARLTLESPGWYRVEAAGGLAREELEFLSLYAPYALAGALGGARGRCFAVSHFAQSLDGRIATHSGNSRWIGNPENLLHAHRMRALCDGVLVGAGTLRRDQPSLTVRHVEGGDPVRIVLGSAREGLDSLLSAGSGAILVVGEGPQSVPSQVEVVSPESPDARFEPGWVLDQLFRRGIRSVYIEGGSETTSSFLGAGSLDVVQLHWSPLVVGSGLSSFTTARIERIEQAVRFDASRFVPVGDGVMFVGSPVKPAREP